MKRKVIYILIGEDDFSLHHSLVEIRRSLGEDEGAGENFNRLEGENLTLDELRNTLMTLPFFSAKRLVVVNGLLTRFEARKPPRGQKSNPKYNPADEWIELILAMPPSTILVFYEPRPKKEITHANPLYQAIAPHAEVREFPRLQGARLKEWIVKHTEKLGGTISAQATDALAWMVGGDLWAMSGELEKLVLYAHGRRIEEEDVRKLAAQSKEVSIFELVDAFVELQSIKARRALSDLLLSGASPAYIVHMLARQIRNLIIVRSLKSTGHSEEEMRKRLGMPANFAWRKTCEQASRYTAARLKNMYQRLYECDLQIKRGEYPPQLALELLLAELCPPPARVDAPQSTKLKS